MREFFHGWRRKLGCITLVMACVLMVMWMRSRVVCDSVEFSMGGRDHFIASMQSGIAWCARDSAAKTDWRFGSRSLADAKLGDMSLSQIVELLADQGTNLVVWTIPYWPLTIPTGLMSATLLLAKPRHSPNPTT